MTTLYNYHFFCNTEQITKSVWRDDTQGVPTKCPDDTSHDINVNSIRIVNTIDKNIVEIQEETVPTGGHFKALCQTIDILANETKFIDISFKFNISALAIEYISDAENKGDQIELIVGPDKIIGTITNDVQINDTIIHVSDTVLQYIKAGYKVNLFNGLISENLGYVLSVDLNNKTITVENGSTNVFSTVNPVYVRINVYVVENYTIGKPGRWEIGNSKIGGSFVPANTILRIIYYNNTASPKSFAAQLEYLY